MRHKVDGRKLGRKTEARMALLRTLSKQLVLYGQVETTLPKAKELKRFADKLVTDAKAKDLQHIRLIERQLADRELVHKLTEEIAPRFSEVNGGYTSLLKTGFRKGDGAPTAIVRWSK
ncbi:50S ribosomal protein L17 [Coprothermobacter platensis]|jgi:large subunit ribosomal protein L17|uniref:50S ribosomal protein L17 n=1 Tax=Coprothermobacter platensis TaxID=108819 RepID=UPI00036AB177|nr:50S ribosomal protein L17 [Coprothermobacter platensis]